ncbi:MAG: hypothetical protein WC560_12835, partial [Syntrophales bacterium]
LSPTTSSGVPVTIDFTAPVGQVVFASGFSFTGQDNLYGFSGISIDAAFTSVNNCILSANFSDNESGLAISWNNFVINRVHFGNDFGGDPGSSVTWDRYWKDNAQLNINEDSTNTINMKYRITCAVANKTGIVYQDRPKYVIIDNIKPGITKFDINESNRFKNYKPSSRNFIQFQDLELVWTASDNVFNSEPALFNNKNHQGIHHYQLYYNKPQENPALWNSISSSIEPTLNNEIIITEGYLLDEIKEGKIMFRLFAFDFASNSASSDIGPFYMDLNNTITLTR